MKKELGLRKSSDFSRILKNGRSWVHPLVVLYGLPNERGQNRYGFAASKRVGKATARNRAKRLMREAVRSLHDHIERGWDFVLIARGATPHADFHQVQAALLQLVRKAGLERENETSQSEMSG